MHTYGLNKTADITGEPSSALPTPPPRRGARADAPRRPEPAEVTPMHEFEGAPCERQESLQQQLRILSQGEALV